MAVQVGVKREKRAKGSQTSGKLSRFGRAIFAQEQVWIFCLSEREKILVCARKVFETSRELGTAKKSDEAQSKIFRSHRVPISREPNKEIQTCSTPKSEKAASHLTRPLNKL
jgi:hypothetical protein